MRIPATVKDRLLTAPVRGLSSVAREVPTTWEAVPKATPWLTGSWRAQKAAQAGSGYGAENAGDDNGGGGEGFQPPVLLGQDNAHGGGDALGQQRNLRNRAELQQTAQPQHHQQAGKGSGGDPGKNRRQVLFQHLSLLVKGQSQAHGGRGQKPGQPCGACLIALHRVAQQQQNGDNQGNGNENRVKSRVFSLFLDEKSNLERSQGQSQRKQGSIKEHFSHFPSLPFPKGAWSQAPTRQAQ